MQNTTSPAVLALEPITFDLLSHVSGGCGGHKRGCPCPQSAPAQQMQVVQLPAMPAAPLPPSGPLVSTSVSINGQPQAVA